MSVIAAARKCTCCQIECNCADSQVADTQCLSSGTGLYHCCHRAANINCNCVCDKPVSWYFFFREKRTKVNPFDEETDYQIELIQRPLGSSEVYDFGLGNEPVNCLAVFYHGTTNTKYVVLPVTATITNNLSACSETIDNGMVMLEVGLKEVTGDPSPQILWECIGPGHSLQPFFKTISQGGCWDQRRYREGWWMNFFATSCPTNECLSPQCDYQEDLRTGTDTCYISDQGIEYSCIDRDLWGDIQGRYYRQLIQYVELSKQCEDCIDTGSDCTCP